MGVLIAARALQGAGAAMQLSSALATLSHAFHGEARGRAFAFWGSVVGIGIASGPVIGGLITQRFGWEWAFYVNLPIGIALIAPIARGIFFSVKDLDRKLIRVFVFIAAAMVLICAIVGFWGPKTNGVRLEAIAR